MGAIFVGAAFKIAGFVVGAIGTILGCLDNGLNAECFVNIIVTAIGIVAPVASWLKAKVAWPLARKLLSILVMVFGSKKADRVVSTGAVLNDLRSAFLTYGLPAWESLLRKKH
jgi:phage-related holin